MATTKAVENKMAKEVAEAAEKAAKESQEVLDTMLEIGNKAFANTKPMVEAQQKAWEDSFAVWQETSNSSLAFVTKATQQLFDQSMAFQKNMFDITEANLKQAQELYAAEQAMLFEAAEAFQAQSQAANERLAKMFTPIFPIK